MNSSRTRRLVPVADGAQPARLDTTLHEAGATTIAARVANGPAFMAVLALLLAVYACWLLAFWPGVLGHDSFAILRQVEQPEAFTSGKPAFWYGFVALFYRSTLLVEVPIGAQMVFAALVFARVLSWQWASGLRWLFGASLLLICLAPHVVFYLGLLYPDGIFSVATTGMLFELWLAARRRRLSGGSILMIAFTLPVALFARTNGLLLLLPIVVVLCLLDRAGRRWLGAITLCWCAGVAIGARAHHDESQGALYPLAIFETVNFLRPVGGAVAGANLSPPTIEVLAEHRPLENYLAHFDPYYWDPLVHVPDGPRVGNLPIAGQVVVMREFLRTNLWHNLPRFVASRMRVFFAAATARSGIPQFGWAKPVLANLQTRSEFRRFELAQAEAWLTTVHDFSLRHRWLLWSPLPGIALLLWLWGVGIRSREAANLVVTVPMVLQLGAIIVFSTAAEYRYLLPFYILPLLLLPMVLMTRASAGGTGPVAPDDARGR